jgi:hypothetical protein
METDARYKQIESETTQETQATQSKFAFTGFGRSTDIISSVDTVMAENQKRKTQLAAVISMETMLEQMQEHGDKIDSNFYKALSQARTKLDEMNQEAAKRRAQIASDLMGLGIKEENKHQVALQYRNSFRPKKYKTLKLKPFTFKAQKIEPIKSLSGLTQSLSRITKIGNHLVKPLSLLQPSWRT